MASPPARWAGRILSGLAILFLIFDGVIKLAPLEVVSTTMSELGHPTTDSYARFLGMVTLACRPFTPGRARRCWARSC